MSIGKQTKPIRRTCVWKDCVRDATIGIYEWMPGETNVDLDRPVAVVCGEHKPRHNRNSYRRNVRIVTR